MKLDYKSKKILNLSSKEAAIIDVLKFFTSAKVTFIAQKAGIPRTTVEFLLKNLRQRGLVDKIKIANHYEWQKVKDQDLVSDFRHLINNLDFYAEAIGKIENKSIVIEVFQGKEKIEEAAKSILSFNKADRVLYIQTVASAKYQTETFAKEFVLKFHQEIKKKDIIMEAVCSEEILPYFNKLDKEELKSHIGRPLVNYLIQNKYVDFEADIILHNEKTIIINYQDKSVLVIKNKLIFQVFLGFFELMKNNAKKYDLNEYIGSLLTKYS